MLVRNPKHPREDLPALWGIFMWYSSFAPLLSLTLPLIDQNVNHAIWISAIAFCFVFVFPAFAGYIVNDILLLILYIISLVSLVNNGGYNPKMSVLNLISSTLYFVFFLQYSIPYAKEKLLYEPAERKNRDQ